jgi:hypothetical protein
VYTISPSIVPGLRQTNQDVLLVPTGTYRKPDQTLLDVRLGRRFTGPTGISFEPQIEVYNLLNENGSLTEVEQVGASLGRISRNIDGRLVRFSLRVGF